LSGRKAIFLWSIPKFQEPLLKLLRFQVPGWVDFFDQFFRGLNGRFYVDVALAVIRRKVPDGDAPSVHGSSENASVKLRPVVRSKAHWDADFDKIVDNDMHTSRAEGSRFHL
jgi:hypothetical protein